MAAATRPTATVIKNELESASAPPTLLVIGDGDTTALYLCFVGVDATRRCGWHCLTVAAFSQTGKTHVELVDALASATPAGHFPQP